MMNRMNEATKQLNRSTSLRVARGLFRLWLVLSVLWIGVVGLATWRIAWRIADPAAFVLAEVLPLALVPPVFVLALGSALMWAFRGFR